jgi:hypothetical protein
MALTARRKTLSNVQNIAANPNSKSAAPSTSKAAAAPLLPNKRMSLAVGTLRDQKAPAPGRPSLPANAALQMSRPSLSRPSLGGKPALRLLRSSSAYSQNVVCRSHECRRAHEYGCRWHGRCTQECGAVWNPFEQESGQ